MTRKTVSAVMAVLMALALFLPAAQADGWTMFVYTENGKALNVRSSMETGSENIIGYLAYATPVTVYSYGVGGWAQIANGAGSAYVMSRYLVSHQPPPVSQISTPRPQGNSSTPKTTPSPAASTSTKDAVTVEEINSLLRNARVVTPYQITVRPPRASGWVYVRWVPSRNARPLATYPADSQLTVLAELKDWYQVQDPANGCVGFVYKSYVVN